MKCKRCNEERTIDQFYKNNKSTCKECLKEKTREYKRSNVGYHRKSMLMKTYGLTLEDFDRMLKEQDYGCAICGSKSSGDSHSFRVDHNHETGEVRGLLCNPCNLTLGNAKECSKRLRSCAEYLEERGSYDV